MYFGVYTGMEDVRASLSGPINQTTIVPIFACFRVIIGDIKVNALS